MPVETSAGIDVAIWIPLAVGAGALAATILIHALAVTVTVSFARHHVRVGRAGAGFWIDGAVVAGAIFFTLVAHLLEIGVWALVFMVCGEFPEFAVASYHSAVNYTTLGYGDVIMTASWKFLGPLEAANGMLLFGVSTALGGGGAAAVDRPAGRDHEAKRLCAKPNAGAALVMLGAAGLPTRQACRI